jgi:uncharacterized repeat protein (TIGR01451 family)
VVRGAAWLPCLPAVLGLALLTPCAARAMTADGALITNVAYATLYWGAGGGSHYGTGVQGGLGGNVGPQSFSTTYSITSNVLVSCPRIGIQKMATPTQQSSGSVVSFTICLVNNSLLASAWGLVITDKLPDNMSYVNPSAGFFPASPIVGWQGAPPYMKSDTVLTGAYAGGEPANGAVNPLFLRWVLNPLGPGRSACVYYAARVL